MSKPYHQGKQWDYETSIDNRYLLYNTIYTSKFNEGLSLLSWTSNKEFSAG